jgi:hypothetical protein
MRDKAKARAASFLSIATDSDDDGETAAAFVAYAGRNRANDETFLAMSRRFQMPVEEAWGALTR